MQIDNPERPAPATVVVGAGHAAGRAVEALRGGGFKGRLVLVGEEPWLPYERPQLSKGVLAGTVALDALLVRPLPWYEEQRIELLLGRRVDAIDRRAACIHLSDGRSIAYDRLLLTTGARARPLAIEGADAPGVHAIRSIGDALALRERLRHGARLLVVGAGFIGLEVAAMARGLGCDVTVIEAGPQPLGRVADAGVGDYFAELHRSHGVQLRTRTTLARIHRAAGDTLVAQGHDRFAWRGDVVVAGVGSVPNVELAAAAGLHVENGIRTDAWGRTEDPAIHAAGDASAHFNPLLQRHVRLETWQNAQNQAIAVAKVMAGGSAPYSEVPWFWTDQYGINFQFAGMPLAWDAVVWRGDPAGRQCSVFQLQQGVLVGAVTVNQGRQMRTIKQLIARRARVDATALRDATLPLERLLPTVV